MRMLAALVVAVAGLFIWTAMFLGRDFYFDLMGLTGTVREQAVSYWKWNAVFQALFPAIMVMWRLVYADGETVMTSLGDFIHPFLTLALAKTLVTYALTDSSSRLRSLRRTAFPSVMSSATGSPPFGSAPYRFRSPPSWRS